MPCKGMKFIRFGGILFLVAYSFERVASQDDLSENDIPLDSIPSPLTVTTWNDMPYSGVENVNGEYVGTGYAFYLFELLSAKLNFTYKIVPPKEHVLGDETRGILGLLHQGHVDMAVAFLPVLPEMRRYCSFSAPLDESRLTALMKRPQESATGSGLLAPFDETVWLLVLVSILTVSPIIYFFALVRAKLWHDSSENFSLPSCFWFVYSSLLKQGTNIMATTDSTRMLFATWWVFILILTSFYTANLTAFLTKPRFTLPINSLQDIVTKGYKWSTYRGRTIEFLLSQKMGNELSILNRSAYYRERYISSYKDPVKDIMRAVNRKVLYLGEDHFLRSLVYQDFLNKTQAGEEYGKRCTYVVMPGTILVKNRAFGFRLNSSLPLVFNKHVISLVEAGIVDHTKVKDLPMEEVCPVDIYLIDRQLRNVDLALTYKVVAGGYILAGIVFAVEILLFCLIRAQLKRRSKRQANNYGSTRAERTYTKMDTPVYTTNNYMYTDNASLFKRMPLPPYEEVETNLFKGGRRHYINGRDYYIYMDPRGEQRLIPIRTPSAFLFQYTS